MAQQGAAVGEGEGRRGRGGGRGDGGRGGAAGEGEGLVRAPHLVLVDLDAVDRLGRAAV